MIQILTLQIKKVVNLMCCYCLSFNEDNKNSRSVPLDPHQPFKYIHAFKVSQIHQAVMSFSVTLTENCLIFFLLFFPPGVCNCAIPY